MKKLNSMTTIAVLCAGTFLAASPSSAQWATYDQAKVLEAIQTYTTTTQGYMETVNQTTSVTSMQQAIGDNVGSLSTFVDEDAINEEDLAKAEKKRKRIEKMKKLAKKAKKGIDKAKEIQEKGVVGYAAGEMGADDKTAAALDSAAKSAAKGDFSGAAALGASKLGADESTSAAIGSAAGSAAKGDFSGAISQGATIGAGKLGMDDKSAAMVGSAAGSASTGDFKGAISQGASMGAGQLGMDDESAAMVGSAASGAMSGDLSGAFSVGAGQLGLDDETSAMVGSAANSAVRGDLSGAVGVGAGQLGVDPAIAGAAYDAARNRLGADSPQDGIGTGEDEFMRDNWDGEAFEPTADVNNQIESVGPRKFTKPAVSAVAVVEDPATQQGGAVNNAVEMPVISRVSEDIQSVRGPRNPSDRYIGTAVMQAPTSGAEAVKPAVSGTVDQIGGRVNNAVAVKPTISGTTNQIGGKVNNAVAVTPSVSRVSEDIQSVRGPRNPSDRYIGTAVMQAPTSGAEAVKPAVSGTVDQIGGRVNNAVAVKPTISGTTNQIGGKVNNAVAVTPSVSRVSEDIQSVRGPREPRVGIATVKPTVGTMAKPAVSSGRKVIKPKKKIPVSQKLNQVNGRQEVAPVTDTLRKSFKGRKKVLKPAVRQEVEKVSDNHVLYRIVYSSAFAQEGEAPKEGTGGVKTGTDEYGNFIFSDIIAEKCGLNYNDKIDEEVILKCYNIWLKGINDKNQTIRSDFLKEHKEAWSHHVAADLAQAIVNKNYAASFDEEVVDDQKNKAQATSTERDEISFFGTVSQTNQKLLLKLMTAESSNLITGSWSMLSEMDSGYLDEEEETSK